MTEANFMRKIQLHISKLGHRLFRNNVGLAFQGRAKEFKQRTQVTVEPGDVVISGARRVRYGLCKGSSDLVGWTAVTIEAKHIGMRLAIFTALEIKTENGKLSEDQRNFLRAVKLAGGFAGVAKDVDGAAEIVEI